MLKWRKQTPEKAASLGTNLQLVNLGQLREGMEAGRIGGKEETKCVAVCYKAVKGYKHKESK